MDSRISGSSSLRRLMNVVAPPLSGGTVLDWGQVSRDYRHAFPMDYIHFMNVYGEGIFDNFLAVNSPFPDAYPNDLSSTVRGCTDDIQVMAEEEGYDAPELLIAWGNTVDSDLLAWRMTDVDPEHWTSVIWRRQWVAPDSWVHLDCGMVELLYRWATNEIPHFGVRNMELPYEGSRFLRSTEENRLRDRGTDPWGADPIT